MEEWIDFEWIDGVLTTKDGIRDFTELDAKRMMNCVNEVKKLKEALKLCNEERIWCYSCQCAMGNVEGGIKHLDNCEYVELVDEV